MIQLIIQKDVRMEPTVLLGDQRLPLLEMVVKIVDGAIQVQVEQLIASKNQT